VSWRSSGSASRRPARCLAGAAALLVLLAGARVRPAEAARKTLIVLDFKGHKAHRAQRGVIRLLRPSAGIIRGKEFARAARDVEGYTPDASGVAKVAARMRAHGILAGKVIKRGSRYSLTLEIREGRTGEVVADEIIVPLKDGRLERAAQVKLERELKAVLKDLPDLGDKSGERDGGLVAAGPGGEPDDPAAPAGEPAPGRERRAGSAAAAPERSAQSPPERSPERSVDRGPEQPGEAERPPRRTRVASAEDTRADARRPPPAALSREAAERADLEARSRAIDLAAGASFVSRRLSFDFNDGLVGRDQPQGYSGGLVPGVYAAAELYPAALSGGARGVARSIGVSGEVDKVLVIRSKLQGSGGEALPTSQLRFGVGLVYRWNFGSRPSLPTLKIGARYNRLSFTIDESAADDPTQIKIPDVEYAYVDPGLELRVPLGERLALVAGGRYVYVLDAGQIQDGDRYGDASSIAFDADLAGELKLTSSLLARVGARFTQIGLRFDGSGDQTDPTGDGTQDVTAATDRYFGVYAAAGVLF
jgi:hypothetical protein